MDFKLLKHFVDNNIITVDTEVKMMYDELSLDKKHSIKMEDYFFIEEIKEQKENYSFKLKNMRTGKIITETSDNITGIDGMTVARFCAAFNFDTNGNKIEFKKKTGRKTKGEEEYDEYD